MRRFEFVDGKSSKFWQISLEGTSCTVQYGKLGTDGQTQVKEWPTAAKALTEHDRLVKEKTGKGYVEVGGGADGTADDGTAAGPVAAKAPGPKKAPKVTEPVAPGSTDGWLDAGGGYALGIRDGAIACRNDKGKVLASVPKPLKEGEAFDTLTGALEFLVLHAAECRETVETWMLRSLPVPRGVLTAVWADPDWRTPLENLIVEADGVTGILRAVEDKGIGLVNLDGETKWLARAGGPLSVPHPILLGELDDWRSLLAELAIAQGTAQLFRETFPKPADPTGSSVTDFQNGSFDMLAQANNEARKLGYRVSGGCAVCRVWENGGLVEARYYIGDGDPMYECTTGDLSWVDGRQTGLGIARVGAVAFSEGMRMASAIYAKRKIEKAGEDDDV